VSRGVVVKAGRGRTVGLSSTFVQFESGDYLLPESTVEIYISWPARLETQSRCNSTSAAARFVRRVTTAPLRFNVMNSAPDAGPRLNSVNTQA
jgi:hypothetical protein